MPACLMGTRQYVLQISPLSTGRLALLKEAVTRFRAALHDRGIPFKSKEVAISQFSFPSCDKRWKTKLRFLCLPLPFLPFLCLREDVGITYLSNCVNECLVAWVFRLVAFECDGTYLGRQNKFVACNEVHQNR